MPQPADLIGRLHLFGEHYASLSNDTDLASEVRGLRTFLDAYYAAKYRTVLDELWQRINSIDQVQLVIPISYPGLGGRGTAYRVSATPTDYLELVFHRLMAQNFSRNKDD